MYVSHSAAGAASYDNTTAAQQHKRPISKERAAVEAQLAHNREMSKANAANLAKVANADNAKTASTAATTTAATAAGQTAASGAQASTATTKNAANTSATSDASKGTETQHKQRHSAIYEKQSAYLQSQAKINAALLAKVSHSDTPKTSAATTASTVAADAATNKYMAHAAETQTATTNITV